MNHSDGKENRRGAPAATWAVLLVLVMILSGLPSVSAVDTDNPYVKSHSPFDMEGDVDILTNIDIVFSEAVKSESLENHITIKDNRGFNVAKIVSYNEFTDTAICTPLEHLRYTTNYIVIVSKFVQDLAGNHLRESVRFSFNTTREKVPPEVSFTSPYDNESDVSIGSNITVVFTEEMDTESLLNGMVIVDSGAERVIGNITPAFDGMSMTFDPLYNLVFGEEYTITVRQTVKDLVGNNMAQDYVFTFNAQLEKIRPRVVTIDLDKAEDVPRDVKLHVTFSEPMNTTSLVDSVLIKDPDLEEVDVTHNYIAANYTLVVIPKVDLVYQTRYAVIVTTQPQDLAGNILDKEYKTNFTTVAIPQQPPTLNSWTPPEDSFNWYESVAGAAEFFVEAEDPNYDILLYTWSVNGVVKEGENAPTFQFFPQPGSEGAYLIQVEVSDGLTAPVRHHWIIEVIPSERETEKEEEHPLFTWRYAILILVIIIVTTLLSVKYFLLMDRRREILARTRRRLRPLQLRKAGPKKPPTYEEMYLRADGVYSKTTPEFKPIAAPSGGTVRGATTKEARVDTGAVISEAPQLLEAKEVEITKATVGPYSTAAPELAKQKPKVPGVRTCPKCGGKVIEAAHGRYWCDVCGFIT